MLFSSYFPPRVGGSGTVYRNLFRHLDQDMIDVVTWPVPPHLRERTDPLRCRVHTAGWRWPRWVRGQDYLDLLLIPVAAFVGIRVARRSRPSVIVATVPELASLLAAYLVHLVTRVPLVPYLHDTIIEGQTLVPHRWLAKRLQQRVLSASQEIFVLSEALAELYRDKYDVETVVIPHCIEDDSIEPASRLVEPVSRTVGFSGAIYNLNRDSLARMAEALDGLPDVRFVVSTPGARTGATPFEGRDVDCRFIEEREDLIRFQRTSGVLYLPLSFSYPGGRGEIATVVPTKLFEYLVSGRPILVHAPDYCFLTRFARREGFAVVIDEPDPAILRGAVTRLLDDPEFSSGLVRNAFRVADRYRGARVAAKVESELLGIRAG